MVVGRTHLHEHDSLTIVADVLCLENLRIKMWPGSLLQRESVQFLFSGLLFNQHMPQTNKKKNQDSPQVMSTNCANASRLVKKKQKETSPQLSN